MGPDVLCLLLLLSLLGGSSGFPAGVEYQYRYNGRVLTRISLDEKQFAATGIQADVTLQVTRDGRALIELSNVEVGSFHDTIHCDPSAPVPIQYHPLRDDSLLHPYTIHFNGSQPEYLDTPPEPAWTTNIRKSVANIIKIAPLQGHKIVQPTFMVVEDTMAGHCHTWYTLLKLPQYQTILEDQRLEELIEEDVQRPASAGSYTAKTRGRKQRPSSGSKGRHKGRPAPAASLTTPPFSRELWDLTSTVRFDTCRGGFSFKDHSDDDEDSVVEQSSVGHYLMRGSVGAWRLERAVVEGSVQVISSDDKREKNKMRFLTFTNQTLQLVAVRRLQRELSIDYQPQRHYSFSFQPHHSHGQEEQPPGLEEYLTGVQMPQQTIIDAQALAVESIKYIAESIPEGATGDPPLVDHVTRAVDMLSRLTHQEIETVVTKLPRDDIETHQNMKGILQRLVMATGTKAGVEYVLQQLRQPEYHPPTASVFFQTASNTVKNPALVQRIVDTFLTMTWTGRAAILKSPALLNLAKLVNKLCLRPHSSTTDENSCHNHTCNPDAVLTALLPTLTQALQDEEAEEWERLVTIQTLCNLGTPRTIPILKDVILGGAAAGRTITNNMRINAIYCLGADYMPKMVKLSVMAYLLPIMRNVGEFPEVRNAAFLTATSWAPSHAWWQSQALSTWHEPSTQVASFVTHTFNSLALGTGPVSQLAGRAVHAAKPVAHTLAHSNYYMITLHNCQREMRQVLAWLVTTQELFPTHFLVNYFTNQLFGGVNHEVIIFQRGLQELLKQTKTYVSKDHSEHVHLVTDSFRQLKEDLELGPAKPVTDFFFWMMINRADLLKTTQNLFDLDGITEFEHWEAMSTKWTYQRNRDSTTVLTTDLGLPLVLKNTEDAATQVTVVPYMALRRPLRGSTQGITLYINAHHSTADTHEVRTLVPWGSGSALVSGLTNKGAVTMRAEVRGAKDPNRNGVIVALKPYNQDDVKLSEWNNIIYTKLTKLFLSDISRPGHPDRTVINPTDFTQMLKLFPVPAAAGIALYADTHEGLAGHHRSTDINNTTSYIAYQTMHNLVLFVPRNSTTTEATFEFYVSTKEARASIVEAEEEYPGQVSQDVNTNYDYMSQVTQSRSDRLEDYQEFGQTLGVIQEAESPPLQQEEHDHLARLQQTVAPAQGGTIRTAVVTMKLEGATRIPKYEVSLTLAESKDQPIRLLLAFHSYPPTGTHNNYSVTCFDLSVERPVLPLPSQPLRPEHFPISLVLKANYGATCNTHMTFMELKGTINMAEVALHQPRAESSLECGNKNELNLTHSEILVEFHKVQFDQLSVEDFRHNLVSLTEFVDKQLQTCLKSSINTKSRSGYHSNWEARPKLDSSNVDLVRNLLPLATGTVNEGLVEWIMKLNDDSTCILTGNQVKTHDGRTLAFDPSTCWTTTTIHYTLDDQPPPHIQDFSVQVRFSDQWEVRLTYPWAGIILEFTNSIMMVNDVPIREPHEKFRYNITRGSMMVEIKDLLYIQVSDSIHIQVPAGMKTSVLGLCGNYDGEPINDMTGPQGCLYSDPKLFALAWTTLGIGCSRFTLSSEKLKVGQYQQACPHTVYQPTGRTETTLTNVSTAACTDWEYPELRQSERGVNCLARVLTPTCRPGCVPTKLVNTPVKYQCSTATHAEETQCHTIVVPTPTPYLCVPN